MQLSWVEPRETFPFSDRKARKNALLYIKLLLSYIGIQIILPYIYLNPIVNEKISKPYIYIIIKYAQYTLFSNC